MDNPLFIIIGSMLVAFVFLIGLGRVVNGIDNNLRQRQAALSFSRWPPVVKRQSSHKLEIAEFGSARWDQVPSLLLWGFFVVAVLLSFPVPGQTASFIVGKLLFISLFLVVTLIVTVLMRSRHTYYRIDLSSGQVQKQTRTFGRGGKVTNYLLKLPVQARADCQYKDSDRRDSFLRFATCWVLESGRRLTVIHRSEAEAEQFRVDLANHGCPIRQETPESEDSMRA